ncbi:hypothetical protein [Thiohalomonas denitrificans]|uniref:Uncharacterized protein n=1 Tax=Thiohalomonas denitrificans TaxID=415747 RepID=A0A1G5PKZ8_9GAMM|nr:hypothetical protein [Thiohalomonas denitrificans]SCZ50204.1 hypothetical protein SAMN03097708_00362 [Thiohalomonas denitrificans]
MAQEKDNSVLTPEEAMNRALLAEQEAAEAIRQCEAEAEQQITDARIQAQRIAERTDERISRLQERCTVAIRHRVDALSHEQAHLKTSHSPEHRSRLLKQAVRQLAEQLTTAEREEQDSGTP